jgi:peptidoglycan biosynthesis protein MviN/MurJ (putative lipid II flippase)
LAVSVAINIVVAFLLVPTLGYLGACLSTIAAESFVFVLTLYFLKRYAAYTLEPSYVWKPLVAAALMAAVAYVGRGWPTILGLVLLLPLAMAAYLGGLLLLGGVSAEEILTARRVVSELGKLRFRHVPGRGQGR